ncbi:hypothetical protein GBAR_LOCUS31609 [Geodia barretti]|uniref:Uncharacterized protein n=1 Tax=Geodia barretti TaxID=519541 RepID=A0AA35U3L9_GEOBA|nr:hypothetical protein GBAR_LOCUS31609 [Geodia barretti]
MSSTLTAPQSMVRVLENEWLSTQRASSLVAAEHSQCCLVEKDE